MSTGGGFEWGELAIGKSQLGQDQSYDLGFRVGGIVWFILAFLAFGYHLFHSMLLSFSFFATQFAALLVGGLITWRLNRWAGSARSNLAETQRAERVARKEAELKAFLEDRSR